MKKFVILLMLLLGFVANSSARMTTMIVSGPGTSGTPATTTAAATVDNCPDAIYNYAWTGDNTSDSEHACIDNGTVAPDTTGNTGVEFSAAYGDTGEGIGARLNAGTDVMCWTIDESPIKGTVWLNLYGNVAVTAEGTMVNFTYDSTNYAEMQLGVDSDDVKGRWNGNGRAEGTGISTGQWYYMGYSWDLSAGGAGDKQKVVVASTDWADGDEEVNALTDFGGNIDTICIGKTLAVDGACNRETYIDNIYFVEGEYEATHPNP